MPRLLLLMAIIMASTFSQGCGLESDRIYSVTYRVKLSSPIYGKVFITYNSADGTEQTEAYIYSEGWQKSFTIRGKQFLYLSAQNYQDSGTIRVEILIDGQVWKSATSSGGYVIATCHGYIGLEDVPR